MLIWLVHIHVRYGRSQRILTGSSTARIFSILGVILSVMSWQYWKRTEIFCLFCPSDNTRTDKDSRGDGLGSSADYLFGRQLLADVEATVIRRLGIKEAKAMPGSKSSTCTIPKAKKTVMYGPTVSVTVQSNKLIS